MTKFTLLCAIIATLLALFAVNAGLVDDYSHRQAVDADALVKEVIRDDDVPIINPDGSVMQHLSVTGRTFAYWKFAVAANAPTRNAVVKMIREDNESDPVLYIKIGQVPSRPDRIYDDADLGIIPEHRVQVNYEPQDGFIYVGVFNYKENTAVFSLQVNVYGCRNSACGGTERGTCAPETGACQCKGGVFGLYCEDELVTAAYDDKYRVKVDNGGTVYFKYSGATIVNAGYLFGLLERSELLGGMTVMVGNKDYPTPGNNRGAYSIDAYTSELNIELGPNVISTGDWIFAIQTSSRIPHAIAVDFSAHLDICLNNCSGHGKCVAETSKCTCDAGYTGTDDCSMYSAPLKQNTPVNMHLGPFSYMTYQINVEKQYTTGHPIELTVQFNTKTAEAVPPILYIRKDARPQTIGGLIYDSISSSPPAVNQAVHIPSHDLAEGLYYVTVDNFNGEFLDGTISYSLIPHCTNDCSGRGTCNALGVCQCAKGFYGGDCSVALPQCYVPDNNTSKSKGWSVSTTFIFTSVMALVGVGLGAVLHKFVLSKYYNRPNANAPSNLAYAQMN